METSKLYRVAIAAAETGVNRTTLLSAIERGEIPSETTGCGLPLVTLAEVRKWAAHAGKRKRGPKAKGQP